MANHLKHVTARLNYAPLKMPDLPLNLTNLDQLNREEGGRCVFLQSNDDVETRPDWLEGKENIPSKSQHKATSTTNQVEFPRFLEQYVDRLIPEARGDSFDNAHDNTKTLSFSFENLRVDRLTKGSQQVLGVTDRQSIFDKTGSQHTQGHKTKLEVPPGRSNAPAVLVVVDKGDGITDAFWFFFYSFNAGNLVLNIRFGNHVGDWEHTLVRFHHGMPIEVFYSEHYFGEAYTYEAVRKIGKRVIALSKHRFNN